MEIPPTSSSTRPGTPGRDIFKIAGRSISGFLPSFKTGNPQQVRMPYTTLLELKLALFLEYHPHVSFYQRGDASEVFARAYRLVTPLGTPTGSVIFLKTNPTSIFPISWALSVTVGY